MKLQIIVAFASLFASFVASESLPNSLQVEDILQMEEWKEDNMQNFKPQRLRALKKGGKGSGSSARSGNGGSDGLIEIHPCVPWDQISEDRRFHSNGDSTCQTNTCGGGCCRAYNWLLCDTKNSYPYVACVCNGNTRDPENFVPDTIPPYNRA